MAFLAAIAFLTACSSTAPEQAAYEVQHTYEEAPARLTLKVSRQQISVADRLDIRLEAEVPEGAEVTFPDLSGKLGEFTVLGSTDADPRLLDDNRVVEARNYQLEPFLAGEYELPAIEVQIGDDTTIATEPVTIQVASVIPDAEGQPEIKEIAPPVELPGLAGWIWFLMGAGATALAVAAYFLWRRRKRREAATPAEPPHQIALRELRELLDENLIEKGQAKLFYLRVSNILRHYIEDRFGLHAPERTTEEFLDDLGHADALDARQKELLKNLLTHCDMVKFAEHQPNRAEVDDTVNACAQFIAETRPKEEGARGGKIEETTPEPENG
ncbi:MAG: DUF4381 family protein [bacterium]|nr:DUF4381 family protein [bacterium]